MGFALTTRERRWLALVVLLLVAVRLATLGAYPLMDSTESRYAEIARKMLETGNWVSPQSDYGVPFWAKPPLSTWLTAASMALFGVNEFGARISSLLLVAGCGWLVWRLARGAGGRDAALWALTLFASTGLVYIASGAAMTDAALALGTTLSMAGFWLALHGGPGERRAAGIAFFAGLAVGLLAKGPIAAVLTFLPIGAWVLWTAQWRAAWTALPWIGGTLLAALLVVPWYWAAERATPGFIDYFLIGEHWKRFVEPGWKGDLYGTAHKRPHGMIWLFWIAAALPWSLLVPGWLAWAALRRHDHLRRIRREPWLAYLLLWSVAPMLFFTVSGNVLWTYVLPGLPAFALLFGELCRPAATDTRDVRPLARAVVAGALLLPLGIVAAIAVQHERFDTVLSQRALVRAVEALRTSPAQELIYVEAPPASAEFYSRGKVRGVANATGLLPWLADDKGDFYALPEHDAARLPEAIRARLVPVARYGEYRLFREAPQ